MINDIELEIEYLENFPPSKNLVNQKNPFVIDLIYAGRERVEFDPFHSQRIPTGIKIKFPEYTYGYLMPFEQKVFDKGLITPYPGIFTPDHSGEIHILLMNMSESPYRLNPYAKIGQLLINHGSKLNFNLNLKKRTYNKRVLNVIGDIGDNGVEVY